MIAIQLSLPDLLNFCLTNKKNLNVCKTDRVWNYKLQKDFPEYNNNFNKNKEYNTKEKKYKLLYSLQILNNYTI